MERVHPAERAAFQHQKIINSGRYVEPLGSGFLMSVFQPTMMTNIVDCDLDASSPRTAGLHCATVGPQLTNNKVHNVTRCDRMIIHGPLGQSLQQCAEFALLRNRGFGPLAVTVLPVALASRAAGTRMP